MEEVLTRGTAASARSLGFKLPAAGKTGTTNDYKDAWFVGYTSSITCGVWVGFDQPTTIIPHGYGAALALPVWTQVMNKAAQRYPAERVSAAGRNAGSHRLLHLERDRDQRLCRGGHRLRNRSAGRQNSARHLQSARRQSNPARSADGSNPGEGEGSAAEYHSILQEIFRRREIASGKPKSNGGL